MVIFRKYLLARVGFLAEINGYFSAKKPPFSGFSGFIRQNPPNTRVRPETLVHTGQKRGQKSGHFRVFFIDFRKKGPFSRKSGHIED